MKRKLIAISLIIALLQGMATTCIAATQSELENQKSNISDQKKNAESQLDEVQEELSAQMKEIETLDLAITAAEEELNALNAKIEGLETSIEEKEVEIQEKQADYEKQAELLKDRLVALYKGGKTTYLDVLLSSSSLTEFISKYYLIEVMAQCDVDIMDKIEAERIAIENAKTELENAKQEVTQAKQEQETKTNELKVKKQERQVKADALSEDEKSLQAEIDAYDAKLKSVEASLQEVLRKAAEDEARRKQQAANGGGSGSTGSTGNAGQNFDGSFIWPCNNKYVTSRVKIRWGRWHKGLDIGARYESVYAAASGYAYNAENPGGYGTYIMIVHGNGYISLYGHLSSSHIRDGQYVNQGQVIATSGNSGASQGPHLHFEIRKCSSLSNYFSSNFLDPLDYLPSGYTILD